MARPSLVDQVADALLDRIVAGDLPPGSVVPGEIDLSAEHQVSRMTVREAVRTLGAQHILRVERGRGTFVNPVSQWASLDAVIRAVSEGQDDAAAAVQLIELRRFLETGACELAAGRLSMIVFGAAPDSTVHVWVAGEPSVVPTWLVARTAKVCSPAARPL